MVRSRAASPPPVRSRAARGTPRLPQITGGAAPLPSTIPRMSGIRRSHFVCVSCRASWKKQTGRVDRGDVCPRCAGPLVDAGIQLAVPRKRDTAGWRALEAVLAAGLRFNPSCIGCMDGPGYRPRTPREVRERLAHAAATGVPVAEALACQDPTHSDLRPGPGARRAGAGRLRTS